MDACVCNTVKKRPNLFVGASRSLHGRRSKELTPKQALKSLTKKRGFKYA